MIIRVAGLLYKFANYSTVAMSVNKPLLQQILASSVCIADRAGKIIRDVLSGGDLGIVDKGKNDPQTEADRAAQRCIISSLRKQFPKIAIIGEEGDSHEEDAPGSEVTELNNAVLSLKCPDDLAGVTDDQICVWVDPVDGTTEFTQGLLEHVTVLIGIAVGKDAVAGVIHQPYYNYKNGCNVGRTMWALRGAGVGGIERTAPPSVGRIVTTTRSHGTGLVNEILDAVQPTEILRVGGAGNKVLLLMEGKAHAYVFASAGCKRWDTCGPEAILRELGGELTDMYGNRYDYSKDVNPQNTRGVLALAKNNEHNEYVSKVAAPVAGKL